MTPFRNRLKTPEEIELEKKQVELAHYSRQLSERETAFNSLKTEIRVFERVYEEMLGHRIATLEELEWQLDGLLGKETAQEEQTPDKPMKDAFTYFHHRTDLLDESEPANDSALKTFKTLYRDVAKTIHPDLASDDSDRTRRQELMAVANQAYAHGDRKTLEDILLDWEPVQTFESGLDIALALVKVIRDIARVQQDIHAIKCQIEELKSTDIYHFKQRVDESLADGIDLLAEMAATVERDISRAQNRLSLLRGDDLQHTGVAGTPLETRIIRFPSSHSCGVLFERTKGSVDFRDWKRIGAARGAQEVFLDKAIRLDVKCGKDNDCSYLSTLESHDIQALFLYDVDDSIIPHIVGMHGLEELYLSNTELTDRGLLQLAPLKALKRVYIYHTPVTDVGLMYLAHALSLQSITCSGTNVTDNGLQRFRDFNPGCKAVSFKWRYD